jgi:hypothetical protein
MSKLPMANFKTMDKILHHLDFATFFIAMRTAERPRFPIMETRILPVRSCARFCGKYPFRLTSLLNCSKQINPEKALQPIPLRGGIFIFGMIAPVDSHTALHLPRGLRSLNGEYPPPQRLDPRHHARKLFW